MTMTSPVSVSSPRIGPFYFETEEQWSKSSEKNISEVSNEIKRADSEEVVWDNEAQSQGDPEKRKTLTRSPFRQVFRFIVVHLPPLSISLILIWQNSHRHFWFDSGATVWVGNYEFDINDIIHVLQIAAKLYELLVLLSLSSIALDLYRVKLVGGGLPLGLLTSGYRVGDLSYLIHSGLLTAIRSRAVAFAIFIALASILSIFMGPASAIMLVPSSGWWQFQDTKHSLSFEIRLEPWDLTAKKVDPWPSRLDADWLNDTDYLSTCDGQRLRGHPQCPSDGFDTIDNWLNAFTSNRLFPNISIASLVASTEIRRWLSVSSTDDNSGRATLATTPSSAALEVIGYYVDYVDFYYSNSSFPANDFRVNIAPENTLYQPLVSRVLRNLPRKML
jgi:hypothetical protein